MYALKEKIVFPLSRVTAEPVEWLWPGWLAAGTLALLDGDPGQGKSLLSLDLAARLSTGRPLPDGHAPSEPCSVVLLNSEDSLPRTILPRLRAAAADLERIHVFRARAADGSERLPSFPEDCDLLAETISESAARLVIVDPFLAFLSARVWGLNDQMVRQGVGPLGRLAEQTGAAVILVRHLTKGGRGQRALYRGTGAMALIGAARTAFLAGQHADDEEQRLLACTKNNLALPPRTLAYRLAHDPAGQPVIDWTGPVDDTADDVVLAQPREPGGAVAEAITFLQDVLGPGPATRETVVRQAQASGIAYRTLLRAKSQLNILSKEKRINDLNVWFWSLDTTDSDRIMQELFGNAECGMPNAE